MEFLLSVLPLVLVVVAGYALAKTGTIPRGSWAAIETLSFRVLIPATLILAIATSDLSVARFGGFGATLLITLALVAVGTLALRLLPHHRLSNPSFTTLFQTTMRWNVFVALAASEQFLTGGIALLAVAIAVLIPLINIICIVVLASFGPARASVRRIFGAVARNPLVQACAIGLALNLLDVSLPAPVEDTLEMIGRGALAVGLLAVGGGISLRRLARADARVIAGAILRPLITPALFVVVGSAVGLPAVQLFAGVLVFSAPAASNGYIVAKQMGGDADLYADVLTWQVGLSLMLLPVWAAALL
ncbi:AEC family transporter [Sulfitobacter sp. HNIBRBA3233]|uniref:AEC family transporter n=1 Tax=Sulfitobacter marinivivus TaxID=3158558 RepID=UPI0032DE31F2